MSGGPDGAPRPGTPTPTARPGSRDARARKRTAAAPREARLRPAAWGGLPLALWLAGFLVAPLAILAYYSVLKRGPYGTVTRTLTAANYARAGESLYAGIFGQSFLFAAGASCLCLVLALPLAYVMATARRPWRELLMMGTMVPFFANFIVRVYGLRAFLAADGPLNEMLAAWGAGPWLLNDTPWAVGAGMVVNYMPYMALPIYVALDKLDFSLLEAARDLGAGQAALFRRVVLPLARRGLVTGWVLVFVPALGEFLIPDLLGGARSMLLGNVISEQFLRARHWPFGAALTMLLLACMGLALAATRRSGPTAADEATARGGRPP